MVPKNPAYSPHKKNKIKIKIKNKNIKKSKKIKKHYKIRVEGMSHNIHLGTRLEKSYIYQCILEGVGC
jgi:hypothetical protein